MCDRQIDGLTVLKRCEDTSRGPIFPPLTIFYSKMLISLVFDESVMNRRTDRPGYRDARTHLKETRTLRLGTDLQNLNLADR